MVLRSPQHVVVPCSFLFTHICFHIFFLCRFPSNISKAASLAFSSLDINCNRLMQFSLSCKALNSRKGYPYYLLIWWNSFLSFVPVVMKHAQNWSRRASVSFTRNPLLKKSLFLASDALLFKMDTGEVYSYRSHIWLYNYMQKMDASMAKYVITVFHKRRLVVPIRNVGRYLQLVLKTNQWSLSSQFVGMTFPTSTGAIFFVKFSLRGEFFGQA